MVFIKQYLGKDHNDKITYEDLKKFKDQKIEESLNLDYKDIKSIGNFDELTKDVFAFANSAGGLIILGINEKIKNISDKNGKKIDIKIYPGKITWGEPSLTKEQLEHNFRGKIHPWVEDLKIVPIRKSERSGYVVFLIDIPQSENPPHMALNRYYKRLNFMSIPMEHYEVADFFNRRRKPFLILRTEITKVENLNSEYKFTLRFYIQNNGKAAAKNTRLTANFYNLEIISIEKGSFSRLDDLRGGKPSIQFDSTGIFYAEPSWVRIGEILFKVKNIEEEIKMDYKIVAEDMNLNRGQLNFNREDLNKKIQQI